MHFSADVWKTSLKNFRRFPEKHLVTVFLSNLKFELSSLSPITQQRKLNPSQMFLVIVPRICKIAMTASCGETTSKVACEISAFYSFVETLSFGVSKSSFSRDLEKFPFNQSWKLITYRNTIKSELQTKF